MSTTTFKITRIKLSDRKDPLIDFNALEKIGRAATKKAREKAFGHVEFVTIAEKGRIYHLYKNGNKKLITSEAKQKSFPTIEEDLCQV